MRSRVFTLGITAAAILAACGRSAPSDVADAALSLTIATATLDAATAAARRRRAGDTQGCARGGSARLDERRPVRSCEGREPRVVRGARRPACRRARHEDVVRRRRRPPRDRQSIAHRSARARLRAVRPRRHPERQAALAERVREVPVSPPRGRERARRAPRADEEGRLPRQGRVRVPELRHAVRDVRQLGAQEQLLRGHRAVRAPGAQPASARHHRRFSSPRSGRGTSAASSAKASAAPTPAAGSASTRRTTAS